MAHEIKTLDVVGLRGEQAWHGLGVVVEDDLTAQEAAQRFGLTWPVDQFPLSAVGPMAANTLEDAKRLYLAGNFAAACEGFQAFVDRLTPVKTHVANIRTEDCDGQNVTELLGVVGADYQVCQNQELAEFTDALAQTGKVVIESCGSLRNGKRVWFLARGEAFEVGGIDKVFPYILVSNGHDGSQAIRVTPTTVRVVCSNTLHLVIPREGSERHESAAISIRHSGQISDKLNEAKRALSYYGNTLAENVELFEKMQARKMEAEQGMQLFAESYSKFWEVATADDLSSSHEKIRHIAQNRAKRMEKASQAFMARYRDEQSKVATGGSAWAYFNAMTGFVQHDKTAAGKDDTARVSRRIESNLFGINSTRTQEVFSAALVG